MKRKKRRVKLEKGEHKKVGYIAKTFVDCLIATEGLRRALVIARLIHERAYANYRRLEKKYGKIDW